MVGGVGRMRCSRRARRKTGLSHGGRKPGPPISVLSSLIWRRATDDARQVKE
jgi:hypothetical protein